MTVYRQKFRISKNSLWRADLHSNGHALPCGGRLSCRPIGLIYVGLPVLFLLAHFPTRIKNLYALPAFSGQLTADDRHRMGAISRKALRRGVSHRPTDFGIDEIINRADRTLFSQITQTRHCLYHLLPPKTSTHCPYSLRKREHYYQLPHVEYSQYTIRYDRRV